MVRSLPLAFWPSHDRLVWQKACQPSRRLRRGGSAGRMRTSTQQDLQRRYGYFLQVLSDVGRLDPRASAGRHVTAANVNEFLLVVQSQWSSVTLARSVYKIRRMAEILGPEPSLFWLRELEADLQADARPKHRREDVTTDQLLEAGENLFWRAEKAFHLKPKERARLARNGLMVALLAVRPIRHKNFAELAIGTTFRRLENTWWIVLEAYDTKSKDADEKPVPEYLIPLIEQYLATYRPILLGTDGDNRSSGPSSAGGVEASGPLWIATTGEPLTYSAVAAAITATTEATLSMRLPPHAFRRIAKATATLYGGEHPDLAQGVLHHRGGRVGDEHYDTHSSRRAGLALAAIIRELRGIT
jgi:hypothetical protein